jgi:replication-associated recombination protein RarA
MKALVGNTSGSVMVANYEIPATIKSIRLSDRGGAGATVTIIVNAGGQERYVRRFVIGANESATDDIETRLSAGFQLIVLASASVDYYITLR